MQTDVNNCLFVAFSVGHFGSHDTMWGVTQNVCEELLGDGGINQSGRPRVRLTVSSFFTFKSLERIKVF